jgi:hypothetical protein
MKKVNLNGKLNLGKMTMSNLSAGNMLSIAGGATNRCPATAVDTNGGPNICLSGPSAQTICCTAACPSAACATIIQTCIDL